MEISIEPRLRLGREIGLGEFSVVLIGRYKEDVVAIKKIKYGELNDAQTENLRREIDIHRGLSSHASIVTFIDEIMIEEHMYIILEYMPNGSLVQYLNKCFKNNPVVSDDLKKSIITGITTGLDYIHRSSILHRDMKIDNVLIDSRLRVKISDFGFAVRMCDGEYVGTYLLGTSSYIAPDLLLNQNEFRYTKETDVYALGILISTIIRMKNPHDELGEIDNATLFSRVINRYRPPLPPETPPDMASIVKACTRSKPSNRPSTETILSMLSLARPQPSPSSDVNGNLLNTPAVVFCDTSSEVATDDKDDSSKESACCFSQCSIM